MKSAKKLLRGTAILALGAGCFMLGNGLTATEAQAETYTFKARHIYSVVGGSPFPVKYKATYMECTLYRNLDQSGEIKKQNTPLKTWSDRPFSGLASSDGRQTLVMQTTETAKSYKCSMKAVERATSRHIYLETNNQFIRPNAILSKQGNFN